MSTYTKEIYSIIDRLEAKLNERPTLVSNDGMYRSSNYKSFSSQKSGQYYEDQFTKTPYQQLLQTNYYRQEIGESGSHLLPSNEHEIRKIIKEEFNSMMIPFQQDINKTIRILETKLDSIDVLKGSKVNDQSAILSIQQLDKQIENKFKEMQKEFNAKIEEQRNQINRIVVSQKENENKDKDNSNNSVLIKDIDDIKLNMKNIFHEIKQIKDGNYSELKTLNTRSLKVIDFEQLNKCDFKTLNTLDLFQLKDISEGKVLNTFNKQLISTKKEIITEIDKKVNEAVEVGNMIKKLKVNEKISEMNNQLSQFQSHINDIQSNLDTVKSSSSINKPSSSIGFDEINKINQQIIGLKQQVNSLQSKQSLFIEASALEVVSNEIKTKISSNNFHDTIDKLKQDNEELDRAINELKEQINKNQSSPSTHSLIQEKQEIMNAINEKMSSIPNQEAFDEETKKISQLENRIFILESAEKESASVYAHKDDIKFLLDEIDKINERLNENNTKQINMTKIGDIINNKPFYKEENQPVMITNIPKDQEKPKEIQNRKSPFSMAEKDEILDDYNNDQNDFTIQNAKVKDINNEFKGVNEEPKDKKSKKKEDNPDDFDDFDVDEIEEL